MRIPSGVTDQVVYFVAVDITDLKTRETGLTGFTVYRSRNGSAAAAMTTPTVTEVDATNMPGVYKLLLDEDMTLAAGNDDEEMVFHITQASMTPVTRTIDLYRPKITAGETLSVTSGAVDNVTLVATTTTNTDMRGTDGANTTAPDNASIAAILVDTGTTIPAQIVDVLVDTSAILIDTNELQTNQGNWVTATGFATSSALATAQADLDIITGTDGATLSSASEASAVTAFWSDTLTTYTDGMAGKRVKGITAVPVLEGTVNDVSATTTSFVSTLIGYGDTFFDDALLLVEITADQWQGRPVANYTSATGVFTVDEAFISAPANGVNIVLQATHIHPISEIQSGLATSAALATAQTDLDTITGTDGATLATAQGLYAPSKAGDAMALTTTAVDNIWDEPQAGHTTAGTFGKFVDIEVSSVSGGGGLTAQDVRDAMKLAPTAGTPAAGSVDSHLDTIEADTNELQTDWVNGGRLDNLLDGAASAGDPWTTTLPGAYGAGTAGRIIGDNINTTISSRMAESSISTTAGAIDNVILVATTTTNTDMRGTDGANTTAPDNASIAAILVDTGTTIPAQIVDVLVDTSAILTDTGTTIPAQISGLNNIAATDIVSAGPITTLSGAVVNVDLVDTCTTNTDMRGTDSANTVAPDNASIAAILVDTGTTLPATLATIGTNVDAVLVDTGTTLPATLGALATEAKQDIIDANVDAVKVKTDQMTFTNPGELDINIQSLNDKAIIGNGTTIPFDVTP